MYEVQLPGSTDWIKARTAADIHALVGEAHVDSFKLRPDMPGNPRYIYEDVYEDWPYSRVQPRIEDMAGLADHLGVEGDCTAIAHRIYDETECGAYLAIQGEGDDIDGITVGAVVDGTEHVTRIVYLPFPFYPGDLRDALALVEAEAKAIWDETHGCPDCFGGDETTNAFSEVSADGDDLGERPVDPDCPTCHGEGIVI